MSGVYIGKQANIAGTIQPYVQVCGKKNIAQKKLEETADTLSIVILCERTPSPAQHLTKLYGETTGQITIMKMKRVKDTIVNGGAPVFTATNQ